MFKLIGTRSVALINNVRCFRILWTKMHQSLNIEYTYGVFFLLDSHIDWIRIGFYFWSHSSHCCFIWVICVKICAHLLCFLLHFVLSFFKWIAYIVDSRRIYMSRIIVSLFLSMQNVYSTVYSVDMSCARERIP